MNVRLTKRELIDSIWFYLYFFFSYLNFTSTRRVLYYVFFIVAFVHFLRLKRKLTTAFIAIILGYSILIFLQYLRFNDGSLVSIIGKYMFAIYPFFLIAIYRERTTKLFVNIVVISSIIGFIFYFPSLFSDSIHSAIWNFGKSLNIDVEHPWKTSFLIYTVEPKYAGELLRNSANFKEPGYYACYIALAMSFELLKSKFILSRNLLILVVAMITTFSTAGYISMIFIFIVYLFFSKEIGFYPRIVLIISSLLLVAFLYESLDFLSAKIEDQFVKQTSDKDVWGRFGATIKNFEEIKQYPITGKGLIPQTRFDEADLLLASGRYGDETPWLNTNSWSSAMVRFGLPGFVLFMFGYIRSIKLYARRFSHFTNGWLLIFGAMFIVLSSQPNLELPIFFGLLYLGDVTKNSHKN